MTTILITIFITPSSSVMFRKDFLLIFAALLIFLTHAMPGKPDKSFVKIVNHHYSNSISIQFEGPRIKMVPACYSSSCEELVITNYEGNNVTISSNLNGNYFIAIENGEVVRGSRYFFEMKTLGKDEHGYQVVAFYDPKTRKYLSSHHEGRMELSSIRDANEKFSLEN